MKFANQKNNGFAAGQSPAASLASNKTGVSTSISSGDSTLGKAPPNRNIDSNQDQYEEQKTSGPRQQYQEHDHDDDDSDSD